MRTLIVMVKEPRPGRVKTRLGREIGMIGAAWWFRHQALSLVHRLRDPRWRMVLAVAPDAEGLASRIWPAGLDRVPQGRGNLGRRMRRLLTGAPKGPVCLIGADIPGVTRAHVWRAFGLLGRHDAVFGPATDGGFWLVGLKRRRAVPPGLFGGVRWSGPDALSDSIGTLAGMRVVLADSLSDVDTVGDLPPPRRFCR